MAQLDGKQLKNTSLDLTKINPATGQTLTLQGTTKIVQPQAPLADFDLANKLYVDNVAAGINAHPAVNAISNTASITLSGVGQLIDGWTVSALDRILVNAQAGPGIATYSNGIYSATAGAWSRAVDSDGMPSNEVAVGDFTFVADGVVYLHTGWVLATTNAVDPKAILVGTESQLWTQFSETGNISAGLGTYLVGNLINVGAGAGIIVGATQVSSDYAAHAQAMGGAGLTASGSTLGVGSGAGITVNADNIAIDYTNVSQTLGGAGLTGTGILNVGSGAGITVNADNIAIDYTNVSQTLGGAGLTGTGILNVGAGNGIAVAADSVAVNLASVSGLTFSGSTLLASVDNTTIQINAQGQLYSPLASGGDVTGVLANKGLTAGTSEGGPTVSLDLDLTSNGGLTFSTATNAAQLQVEYISVSQVLGGAGLTGSGILNVGQGQGISVTADAIAIDYTNVSQVLGGSGLTGTGILNVGAGNGIAVAADSVAVNLAAVSGLTFSGSTLLASTDGTTIGINAQGQLYVSGGDITGVTAGNGLTGGGPAGYVTLDVNAANGISIVNDYVGLGGALNQDTLITTGINNFTMSSTGSVITFNRINSPASQTHTMLINSAVAQFTSTGLVGTHSTLSTIETLGGSIQASVQDQVNSNITQINGNTTDLSMISTDVSSSTGKVSVGTNSVYMSAKDSSGNTSLINLYTTDQTGGDGSTNNRMIVTDAPDSKGLVYAGNYTANFTTYSLVTKGYVDAAVTAGSGNPVYSQMSLTPTGGFTNLDGQSTGLTITSTPNIHISLEVYVNGDKQRIGNGASASVDCYFGTVASTPLAITSIVAANTLYWNAVTAGFTLSSADIVSIVYNA